MPKLPEPPLPLPDLGDSDVQVLGRGTRVWRVYRTAGQYSGTWSAFRWFGPVRTGRFDHQVPPPHEDPQRAIMYGALDPPSALAELFQDTRLIDRVHDEPWLACFELESAAALLDLRGTWPTRAGANEAISSGRRDRAQAWSREIYGAYPPLVGLVYPSTMAGGSSNVALFERASESLPAHPILNIPLGHPGLELALDRVADKFGYGLR